MARRLDRDSPVPLYHQIVETLRYRIATGQLRPGDALPPLRDAATRWGVNLHTVRRAYADLAAAGLAVIRRPQGASVAKTAPARRLSVSGLAAFLADIVQAARTRFGVDARGLAELLARERMGNESVASSRGSFVECSLMQAEDYARQIERRWNVEVSAHCLDAAGEPPAGPILSTYFHFNDVRRRWPRRRADMRFVAVALDPTLTEALARRSGRSKPARLVLAETNADRARDAVADLMSLFHSKDVSIGARVTRRPGELLEGKKLPDAVLFAPRLWSKLDESLRSHPAAVQLRYVIEPTALSALGSECGWSARDRMGSRVV
ncbi:HTH-type transcriptional repressor YvoA [Phycisphaerae bacterium RAS1]|nr:HTH-type transcriptional repressor YvoA [Phycisphaerae bacterium RAS1]